MQSVLGTNQLPPHKHTRWNNKIMHGDIKINNIMLDAKCVGNEPITATQAHKMEQQDQEERTNF